MKTYKFFTYLLPLLLLTAQASQISDQELNNNNLKSEKKDQDFNNNNTNLEPDKQDLELQKGIEKYLPQFFEKNEQMLDKLQEGKRQAVVVIGQTGAGKSTLIGGLLGHEFILKEEKVTKTLSNGRKMSFEEEVLVNKNPNAPTIGLSDVKSETIFPAAYLDQETNLAFIDTAGLGDVRKDGKAINLCSAIGLRSLIDAIGGVQCIIGVISYNNFIEGKGSNAFFDLLCATSSMLNKSLEKEKQLNNKAFERCASSMVLAFTKVPENVEKKHITNKLKKQCYNFMEMEDKKQEHELVESVYEVLFPSFYSIKNKKNVPFFLIRRDNLLKQGLIKKNMLPTLQSATKVDSKDIGLVLTPYLLQKTRDWLGKRAESVASHIRSKEDTQEKIVKANKKKDSTETQLSTKQDLLKDLTDPNNKDKQETFKKSLDETIKNNTERIKELDLAIENNKKEQDNIQKEIQQFDNNQVIPHTNISGCYNQNRKQYDYTYHSVPIDYILYNSNTNTKYKIKDPKSGDRVSDNYKVVKVTKDYKKGILHISLENNLSAAIGILGGIFSLAIVGGMLLYKLKHNPPKDFFIYAQKKHIYQNCIKTLRKAIKNSEEDAFKEKKELKELKKEIQLSEDQIKLLESNDLTQDEQIKTLKNNISDNEKIKEFASDFFRVKDLIEQTEKAINDKSKEVEKIKKDLKDWKDLIEFKIQKIAKHNIIPYIITKVDRFIDFNKSDQHNIKTCKQYYMKTVKKTKEKNNEDNNNLMDDNTNNKHIDYQPGGELEQKQDDDCDNNNNNNSSSLTSSLLLGTTLVSGSLLKKKN